MKNLLFKVKNQAINAFLFLLFVCLWIWWIIYAASTSISWPSSAPTWETPWWKFSKLFDNCKDWKVLIWYTSTWELMCVSPSWVWWTSQWLNSSNNIYYTWGNVGIGTNNPTSTLTVSWNTNITWNLTVNWTIFADWWTSWWSAAWWDNNWAKTETLIGSIYEPNKANIKITVSTRKDSVSWRRLVKIDSCSYIFDYDPSRTASCNSSEKADQVTCDNGMNPSWSINCAARVDNKSDAVHVIVTGSYLPSFDSWIYDKNSIPKGKHFPLVEDTNNTWFFEFPGQFWWCAPWFTAVQLLDTKSSYELYQCSLLEYGSSSGCIPSFSTITDCVKD